MTDEDLDTIDGQLGVTMPAEYRSLMLAPALSFHGSNFEDGVFDAARPVVSETQRYRIQGLAERAFPPDHVVIGQTGTGDFFCLDLSQDPAPVVEFDHERQRFKTIAFSFTSWLKRLSRPSGEATSFQHEAGDDGR